MFGYLQHLWLKNTINRQLKIWYKFSNHACSVKIIKLAVKKRQHMPIFVCICSKHVQCILIFKISCRFCAVTTSKNSPFWFRSTKTTFCRNVLMSSGSLCVETWSKISFDRLPMPNSVDSCTFHLTTRSTLSITTWIAFTVVSIKHQSGGSAHPSISCVYSSWHAGGRTWYGQRTFWCFTLKANVLVT